MSAISSLNNAQVALEKNIQQLSSGNRINSAADDAAGLAIATRMSVNISSAGQALRNIDNGISMLDTASSGLSQMTDALQNIRTLTLQAGNSTLNADDRSSIQAQINQNIQSINSVAQTGNFNGQNLFDGSFSTRLQIGIHAGDSEEFSIANNSPATLGVNSIDVTNPSNIANALEAVDKALTTVNKQQSMMGAMTNGLQSQMNSLTSSNINLSAAQSSIQSTDYAAAISETSKNRIQLQASIYALQSFNESQKTKLGLLGLT